MMVKKYQIQRLVFGFIWKSVGHDYVVESVARENARKVSGTTRVVPVWVE